MKSCTGACVITVVARRRRAARPSPLHRKALAHRSHICLGTVPSCSSRSRTPLGTRTAVAFRPASPHFGNLPSLNPPPLNLLFPSLTALFRIQLPCQSSSALGPPPAPRPSSQSTLRLPAPIACMLAFLSPPPAVRAPTSFICQSLAVDRLLAKPLSRPECQESLSPVS